MLLAAVLFAIDFSSSYNFMYNVMFSYPFGLSTMLFSSYGRRFEFLSPNQYSNPTYKHNDTLKIEIVARDVRFYDIGVASFIIECPESNYREEVIKAQSVKSMFQYKFRLRFGHINWKAMKYVNITQEMEGNCKIEFHIVCEILGTIECANRIEQVPFVVSDK